MADATAGAPPVAGGPVANVSSTVIGPGVDPELVAIGASKVDGANWLAREGMKMMVRRQEEAARLADRRTRFRFARPRAADFDHGSCPETLEIPPRPQPPFSTTQSRYGSDCQRSAMNSQGALLFLVPFVGRTRLTDRPRVASLPSPGLSG